jgi:hypothetical protein
LSGCRTLSVSRKFEMRLSILRGLIERVSIGRAENGLEIEIVGEVAKMVELGIETQKKQDGLDETANTAPL